MPLRKVMGNDEDFKWLYVLHRPTGGRSYAEVIAGLPDGELPIPIRLNLTAKDTGSNDCIPGSTKGRF